MPPYHVGGALIILLYTIQAEIRFGSRARSGSAGATDRHSTMLVSLSSAVPILGFVFTVQAHMSTLSAALPDWLREAGAMPFMPAAAWVGVALGSLGLLLRLWAVFTLRERYTRTLLIHENHSIERGGPYRFVRHPGYLGSLLSLNGVALASGDAPVFLASLVATFAAYAYRIRVEDAMLVAALGAPYLSYRREVKALLPYLL